MWNKTHYWKKNYRKDTEEDLNQLDSKEGNISKGGFYSANRDGMRVIHCIQVGNTIVFDVIIDITDNRCCGVPTKFISPMKNDDSILEGDEVGVQKECSKQALANVRLLFLS